MTDDKFKAAGRPKPPAARIEQVKASCGHLTDFPVFDDRKDQRFREQRRAKTTGRPCPACRRKAYQERLVQEENAKQEKARKATERAMTQAVPQKPEKPKQNARLPHGSAFHVVYDAAKGEWSGSLAVPDKGEFAATASGVFRLLELLDEQYRQATQSP